MILQGYVRVWPDERPDAVQWWYVRRFDDGYVFARGGNVAKAREARRQIDSCYQWASLEHERWIRRPVGRLKSDGSIEPAQYGPYEWRFLTR